MPTETGSGSSGTPRPRSPSPSGPETAGLPTTWLPTSPSSRAEPGHTSAAGDPTIGARWLRKQQGNLASTVTPNLQTCLSRAVKPGNPTPGNGHFPISLSGVTGSRLAYHIRQDFQVKRVKYVKTTALRGPCDGGGAVGLFQPGANPRSHKYVGACRSARFESNA